VHARTLYAREPGDLSSTRRRRFQRVGQGRPVAHNPDKYAAEKSDTGIVPVKAPNKIGKPIAEVLEGRPATKGNSEENVCDLYAEAGGSIERAGQDT
jgi:hypothetical protein